MEAEKECRVCRDGEYEGHPLFAPCLCNGSILYCHQDCLEAWLRHSGKEKCELCGMTYQFSPKYADNTPEVLPLQYLMLGTVSTFFKKIIPFFSRICLAFSSWFILVPCVTSNAYRMLLPAEKWTFYNQYYMDSLKYDITTGILLSGLITLSFIVMVHFVHSI
jgi:E3 ubiquitin-protein ligase MARCH6